MNRPIAPRWLASLFVLLSLSGCGAATRPAPQPAPVIEVPVPAYRPLPASLTAPLAEPSPPPSSCALGGVPVPCALAGLFQIDAWRGVLQRCNADRATAAQVSAGPKP
ncbi:MAG: hypothetical protein ACYCZD_12860 [Rhodanobacter sp.]